MHADIPNSICLGKNLFWGGDFEFLKERMMNQEADSDKIKFYAGLTYWYSGHLDYEIKTNKWWTAVSRHRKSFPYRTKTCGL
jgi:putative transcriptional regulator